MSRTTMRFAIAPRDSAVGLLSDDGSTLHLLKGSAPESPAISAEWFFTAYPDSSVVELADESQVGAVLANEQRASLVLDMSLLLFDTEVTLSTRGELARDLGELLIDQDRFRRVLD